MPANAGFTVSAKVSKKGEVKWPYKDIRNWTEKEIRKEVGRVRDAVHKRVQRLQQSELPSRALHALMNSGGEITTKGKSLNDLYHEYRRGINFLNFQDSSVGGARKYQKHLEELFGGPLSQKQQKVLFKAYHEIMKASPGGLQVYGSERLIQYLANEIDEYDDDILTGTNFDFEAYMGKALADVKEEYNNMMDQLDQTMEELFGFD